MSDIFSLNAYDYDLLPELIAAHPVSPRDAARLLVAGSRIKSGISAEAYQHKIFRDLVDELNPGDVLVLNSSKVIPARLRGIRSAREGRGAQNSSDVPVEFLLHRVRGSLASWAAFAKPAKRLKAGDTIRFADGITAAIDGREGDQVLLTFNLPPDEVETFLEAQGEMPLPPYLNRAEDTTDKTEYQTVYAETSGSVAAPTAGLHFTDALLQKIKDKGVIVETVTLHVGAGTFLPVTVDDVRQHKMHSEWGVVAEQTAQTIRTAKMRGNSIVAVGTTALRLMETASRATGEIAAWQGETDIFITPGYAFAVVDRLVTNFHLPKSTLFMLVAAFLGSVNAAQDLYRVAIENRYRFYSYGDACLL